MILYHPKNARHRDLLFYKLDILPGNRYYQPLGTINITGANLSGNTYKHKLLIQCLAK